MRIALVVAAFALSTCVAQAQSRDACEMVDMALVTEAFGAEPILVEKSGEGTGISYCNWTGGEGLYLKITSLTAEAQGIVGGTPLDYFLQNQANEIETSGAANVAPLDGPWQAGFRVDVTTEDNSQQFYGTVFLNKDDTVNFQTFGLPKEVHASLVDAVAKAM